MIRAITKLQHILALKDFGFPLETIQEILANQEWSLKDALCKRLDLLKKEQERLNKVEKDIHGLLQLMELEGTTNWEEVFKTISISMNSESLEELWRDYFSKKEQNVLKKLPVIGDNNEMVDLIVELISDVRKNIHVSPKSVEAQDLARRWIDLVDSMFKGNFNLAGKVWKLSNEENKNIGFYKFDKEIVTFIEQAIAHLYQNNE